MSPCMVGYDLSEPYLALKRPQDQHNANLRLRVQVWLSRESVLRRAPAIGGIV